MWWIQWNFWASSKFQPINNFLEFIRNISRNFENSLTPFGQMNFSSVECTGNSTENTNWIWIKIRFFQRSHERMEKQFWLISESMTVYSVCKRFFCRLRHLKLPNAPKHEIQSAIDISVKYLKLLQVEWKKRRNNKSTAFVGSVESNLRLFHFIECPMCTFNFTNRLHNTQQTQPTHQLGLAIRLLFHVRCTMCRVHAIQISILNHVTQMYYKSTRLEQFPPFFATFTHGKQEKKQEWPRVLLQHHKQNVCSRWVYLFIPRSSVLVIGGKKWFHISIRICIVMEQKKENKTKLYWACKPGPPLPWSEWGSLSWNPSFWGQFKRDLSLLQGSAGPQDGADPSHITPAHIDR